MKGLSPTVFLFFISASLLSSPSLLAGNGKMTREQYIALHKDDAVRDMQKTGVPASITLAQALLESDDGNSTLAMEANNHFGVKCANWTGLTYTKDDETKDECFRKYCTVLESYDDHSNFLRTRPRYASLFQLDATDYKAWAKGLKKTGYATNPEYAERLIKIIEDNKLYELDRGNSLPVAENTEKPKQEYQPTASVESKPAVESVTPAPKKIIMPATEVVNPYGHHEILKNNDVPYVIAKKNDTYRKLADEFDMALWQIYKYNEIDSKTPIVEGQKIYIKPKKRSGDAPYYVVKDGETLHDIAQQQGIKLRLLKKWNHLDDNAQVQAGQKLSLKKSE